MTASTSQTEAPAFGTYAARGFVAWSIRHTRASTSAWLSRRFAFLLRRLARRGGALWLVASDGTSPPLPLAANGCDGSDVELWGVAIHAVHHLAGSPSRRH